VSTLALVPSAPSVTLTPIPAGMPALELEGISARSDRGPAALSGVDLASYPGEILGIAGVSGNGQKELGEVVLGLRRATGGKVMILGQDSTRWSTARVLGAGVACVAEDPPRQSIVPEMTVAQNFALGVGTDSQSSRPWLPVNWAAARDRAAALAHKVQLRLPSYAVPAGTLSGGNIQRVVLAREIARRPRILLAYYPTHGLDIGATRTIHHLLREAAADGTAILLVSEDLDELVALSNRIAVLYHGHVAGIFPAAGADLHEIGMRMTGGSSQVRPAGVSVIAATSDVSKTGAEIAV
jgi:general nucleoside transport system ATP-binding protein